MKSSAKPVIKTTGNCSGKPVNNSLICLFLIYSLLFKLDTISIPVTLLPRNMDTARDTTNVPTAPIR